MPVRRALLLTFLVAGACTPPGSDFSLAPRPQQPSGRPQGVSCEAAEQCTTGACVNGVCCEAAGCSASQRCDAPGHLGICTERVLGDRCASDGDCPASVGGRCVDGVCCEGECSGTCRTCASPDAPGKCVLAADNTDARKECGLCGACYSGVCAPALPGTDPNGACGVGRACSVGQVCTNPPGSACSVDSDCARGECLGGRCLTHTVSSLFAPPMYADADRRVVHDVAANGLGDVAVAFFESKSLGGGSFDDRLMLAVRGSSGAVRVYVLGADFSGSRWVGARYVGRSLYVAVFNALTPRAPSCGNAPCGLYGFFLGPNGEPGMPESIDAAATNVGRMDLRIDDSGRPVVAFRSGADLKVLRRETTAGMAPRWATLETLTTDTSATWTLAISGNRPLVALGDPSGLLTAVRLDPKEAPLTAMLPDFAGSQCQPTAVRAARRRTAAGEELALSFTCRDASRTVLGTLSPAGGFAFGKYPADNAQSTLYNVTAFEAGDAAWFTGRQRAGSPIDPRFAVLSPLLHESIVPPRVALDPGAALAVVATTGGGAPDGAPVVVAVTGAQGDQGMGADLSLVVYEAQ